MVSFSSHATVLFRYFDKATGEERGICYGNNPDSPPVNNPDWEAEIIDGTLKKYYMNEHKKQLKVKDNARKEEKKQKKDKVVKKLEDFGFDSETIEAILR